MEVTVGSKVVIKLNSQRYCAKVVDLLEWTPPQKKRPVKRREMTHQGLKQVRMLVFKNEKIVHVAIYVRTNVQV